jgi:hypothetical protein
MSPEPMGGSFSGADFQDRCEALQELWTFAQLGDVRDFFFGERDFFHPHLKRDRFLKTQVFIKSRFLLALDLTHF